MEQRVDCSTIIGSFPNKTVEWVTKHIPDPKTIGEFYSYNRVFEEVYGYIGYHAWKQIRNDLEDFLIPLFHVYGLGIQIGVATHGHRGIRLINLR